MLRAPEPQLLSPPMTGSYSILCLHLLCVRGGRGGHRVPIRLRNPTQAKKVSNYPLSCTCLLCRPLGAARGPCSREADITGHMCDKGPGFTLVSQHPLTGRGPASVFASLSFLSVCLGSCLCLMDSLDFRAGRLFFYS